MPNEIEGFRLSQSDPFKDKEITDPKSLPKEVFFKPGESQPNRKGLANVAAYLNGIGEKTSHFCHHVKKSGTAPVLTCAKKGGSLTLIYMEASSST